MFVELGMNLGTMLTVLLLGYMMDRMTDAPRDTYRDPIIKQDVPFFVYLAATKVLSIRASIQEQSLTKKKVSDNLHVQRE